MSTATTKHINEAMNAHVSNPADVPSPQQAQTFLAVKQSEYFITEDSFNGNPDGFLGSVMQVKSVRSEEDPAGLIKLIEFCPNKIPKSKPDESARLKEPIKRQSFVVDQKLTMEVKFLNYLQTEIDSSSSFSLLVFDQATGQVDRSTEEWDAGLIKWKETNQNILNDTTVSHVFVIIGYVQKYVIRKRFRKFDVKARGGAMGLNVGGELFTSTEDYALDIRYGLTIATLKRESVTGLGIAPQPLLTNPTADEINMLNDIKR